MPAFVHDTSAMMMDPPVVVDEDSVDDTDVTLVGRLSSFPVVSDSLAYVSTFYTGSKARNEYLKRGLESVESSLVAIGEQARPYVAKMESSELVSSLDTFGCKQLDRLEEKYPIVKQPTTELYAEASNIVASKRDAISQTLKTMEEKKAVLIKSVEGVAASGIAKAEAVFGTFSLEETGDDVDEKTESNTAYVARVKNMTSKMRQRVGIEVSRLRDVQLRSQETLSNMQFSLDLIQYTQDYVEDHVNAIRGRMGEGFKMIQPIGENAWERAQPFVKIAEDAASPYLQQMPKSLTELHERISSFRENMNAEQLASYMPATTPLPAALAAFYERLLAAEDPTSDEVLLTQGRRILSVAKETMTRLQELKYTATTYATNLLAVSKDANE